MTLPKKMREFLSKISTWAEAGQSFCTATVVNTWGSSPRPIGTNMFIGPNGEMLGSVSGGCVEGAILRETAEVQATKARKVLKFGVSDQDAWSVGLTCGGTIEILLEPGLAQVDQGLWANFQAALAQNQGCVLLTPLQDLSAPHRFFVPAELKENEGDELSQIALKAYQERKSQVLEYAGTTYFLGVYPPKLQLFVVGAAHAAAELVHLAKYFDFEVTVMDPRGTFAQNTQFTTAPDQLFEEYPAEVLPDYQLDEYSFAVVMAHDPKIDDQALHLLLRSKVAYIGALSSKASNEKRKQRLLEAGFSEQDIQRIHAPVGLPIKSKTAKEIALSIMAQIVAVKNQHL